MSGGVCCRARCGSGALVGGLGRIRLSSGVSGRCGCTGCRSGIRRRLGGGLRGVCRRSGGITGGRLGSGAGCLAMLLGHSCGMAAFGADRGCTVAGRIGGGRGFGGSLAGRIRLCGIRRLGRRVLRGITGGGCRGSGVHGCSSLCCRIGGGAIPCLARCGCILGSRRSRLGLPVTNIGTIDVALDAEIFTDEDAVVGQRLLGRPVGGHLPQAAHGALDIGLGLRGAGRIIGVEVLPARLHLQAEHHFVRRVAPLDEEFHFAAVKCIPGGMRPFLDGFVEVHHAIARDHLLDIGLQRVSFPIGLGTRVCVTAVAVPDLGIGLQGQALVGGIGFLVKDVAEVGHGADGLGVSILATAVRPPAVDRELSVHRLLIGQHVRQIGGIHPLVAIQRLVQVIIRRDQLAGRIVAADRVGMGADLYIGGLRAEDLLEEFGADPGFGDGGVAGSHYGCVIGRTGIGCAGGTSGFRIACTAGCVRTRRARAVGLGRQAAGFGTRATTIVRTATASGQEQGGHRSSHNRGRSRGSDQHVL